MASCKMFGFVTAFDWCSGGYDPFDGSQNGRSRHRATTPEAFWRTHGRGRVRACNRLSATKARVPSLGSRRKLRQAKLYGFTQEYHLEIYYSSICQGGHSVVASYTDIGRNVIAHSITTGWLSCQGFS